MRVSLCLHVVGQECTCVCACDECVSACEHAPVCGCVCVIVCARLTSEGVGEVRFRLVERSFIVLVRDRHQSAVVHQILQNEKQDVRKRLTANFS